MAREEPLEVWEAEDVNHVMAQGRTKPLVLGCQKAAEGVVASQQGITFSSSPPPVPQRKLFVVKTIGLPEITESGLFKEAYGCCLARELGVPTPKPALIFISPQFTQLSHPDFTTYNIRLRPGMGVGAEYFQPGYAPVRAMPIGTPRLSDVNLEQAVRLYAFDLLTQNPDRHVHNPNCAYNSSGIIAYDFESCFSFLYVIGSMAPPWQVDRHQIGSKHVFHAELKRNNKLIDWAPFLTDLSNLDLTYMEACTKVMPSAWMTHSERVLSHIVEVQQNIEAFKRSLEMSVA